jgi:hypothetical protein
MILSEVDGFAVTPPSDLLVEPAAVFDVLSIGIPTSTTGDGHHIRWGPEIVPDDRRRTTQVIGYWCGLLVICTLGMPLLARYASRGF